MNPRTAEKLNTLPPTDRAELEHTAAVRCESGCYRPDGLNLPCSTCESNRYDDILAEMVNRYREEKTRRNFAIAS